MRLGNRLGLESLCGSDVLDIGCGVRFTETIVNRGVAIGSYRVDNLGEMLEQLRAAGVTVVGGPESHENGKFAWIMDPDGNKVELWEPMIWDNKNKR